MTHDEEGLRIGIEQTRRLLILCQLRDIADSGACNMFDKQCVRRHSGKPDRVELAEFIDTGSDSDYIIALVDMGDRRDKLPQTRTARGAYQTLRDMLDDDESEFPTET